MRVPLSWLKDFVDFETSPQDLAHRLTMTGTKIESIERLSKEVSGIVIGRVIEIIPHPNADRLVITKVDVGSEVKQIVTGAKNLVVGDIVPVAVVGAMVYDMHSQELKKIKKGKMRGEDSDGMLVSVEELGYGRFEFPEAPEEGIYVFAPSEAAELTLGQDALPAFGLDEIVLEVELTSNRPDCNSIIGIAREVAAAYGLPLKEPNRRLQEDGSPIEGRVDLTVENGVLCPRYIARIVDDITPDLSPAWMRHRLMAAGVRPTNNIVDITNYVMLEYGQPMHAFDLNAVEGGIVVRNAHEGEGLTTLDGTARKLDPDMLVIADKQKAIGIAGIMGGEGSKIVDGTRSLLFESANFNRANIRKSAKKLGLRTDASAKYEKGLDPELALTCIERACALVEELGCGTVAAGMLDNYPNPKTKRSLAYSPAKINGIIGVELTDDEIVQLLSLCDIQAADNIATIPTYRDDIKAEEDLAEEVARLYGYERIPEAALRLNGSTFSARQKVEAKLVDMALSMGYSQALTSAFESPSVFDKLLIPTYSPLRNAVRLANPLGENSSLMRTTTANSFLTSLSANFAKGNKEVQLFELAKVYHPSEDGEPQEPVLLTMAGYSQGSDRGVFHVKGEMELIMSRFGITGSFEPCSHVPFLHPGQQARFIAPTGEELLCFGRVHPAVCGHYDIDADVMMAIIDVDKLFDLAKLERIYAPLPKFPDVRRDIALLVDSAALARDISGSILKHGGKYLEELSLFDVFTGESLPSGKKSFAFALSFRAQDRTMTDAEVSKLMDKIVKGVNEEHGAEIRA